MKQRESSLFYDLIFGGAHFFICLVSAKLEKKHSSGPKYENSVNDLWKVETFSTWHSALAAFCCLFHVFCIYSPRFYFGSLVFPSFLLLFITFLTFNLGLSHLFLYTLMLHHITDVVLAMVRLSAKWRNPAAPCSPSRLPKFFCLLATAALIPTWLVTRCYWFTMMLSPGFLKPLPDGVVGPAIIVHVLLWLLLALNIFHLLRVVRHCWGYVCGAPVSLGEPFTPIPAVSKPKRSKIPPTSPRDNSADRWRDSSNQHAVALYQTIKCAIRLKRKLRRRRMARLEANLTQCDQSDAAPQPAPS